MSWSIAHLHCSNKKIIKNKLIKSKIEQLRKEQNNT